MDARARPERTRDAIVEAAVELVASHGLRRTSVDDVARAAGVSRATVYRHLDDRDGLTREVLAEAGRRFAAAVDEALAAPGPPAPRLVEAFVAAVAVGRTDPLVQRLLVDDADQTLPLLTTGLGPVVGWLVPSVADRLASLDGLGEIDAAVTAEVLVRLVVSFTLAPVGVLDLSDDEGARRFAQAWIGAAEPAV